MTTNKPWGFIRPKSITFGVARVASWNFSNRFRNCNTRRLELAGFERSEHYPITLLEFPDCLYEPRMISYCLRWLEPRRLAVVALGMVGNSGVLSMVLVLAVGVDYAVTAQRSVVILYLLQDMFR